MVRKAHSSRRKGAAFSACSLTTALLSALAVSAQGQEVLADNKISTEPPLRYGPFDIHYGLRGSVTYDDNIFISHTNKQDDIIGTIAPNIFIGAGDYREQEANLISLSYTPSFILFNDHTGNNAIDHDVIFNTLWRPGSWKFDLQQTYQNYSGAVIDVGNRVNREIYNTSFSAIDEISPKTSVELDARQSINDYKELTSFNEWTIGAWVDYEVMPLLKTGLGVTGGFVDVEPGANQTYQQGLARATYSLTELLDVRGSIGCELREFQKQSGQSQDDKVNPVFTLGGTYRPLENTTLKLDAYRRSQTSVVLHNQNYTTTGFAASIRQVLYEKYALTITGGYENSDYSSNQRGVSATRNDDYYYTQVAFDANVLDQFAVGIFYQYRNNDSGDTIHSFDNHQVGLNISFRF